jgi:hypothetical protein
VNESMFRIEQTRRARPVSLARLARSAAGGVRDTTILRPRRAVRKPACREKCRPNLFRLTRKRRTMNIRRAVVVIGVLAAIGAAPVLAQVHKFFTPATVWTVTMIKVASGMDQAYMEYLDGQFKKGEEAQIKAGLQKSYKILRTMDDGGAWNVLILREYASLTSIEADVEKADTVQQQTNGTDQAQMQGYADRSKYREIIGTKYARELTLK